ncbi:MAG: OsmC family protein [Deltaproteobacteria bacterium]|nr:OsmC family protein [Deltaproteobacteria bacterium]
MSAETLQTVEIDSDSKALLEKLNRIIDKLKNAPPGSKIAEFKIDTELVKGLLTKAQIRHFTLDVDESSGLGGTDKGPNPVELILAALGTCQEIVYVLHAALMGIRLDSVKITVSGHLDGRGLLNVAEVPSGFLDIYYRIDIRSEADQNKIRELINMVNAHCPVVDTLRRPINVNCDVRLNGEAI